MDRWKDGLAYEIAGDRYRPVPSEIVHWSSVSVTLKKEIKVMVNIRKKLRRNKHQIQFRECTETRHQTNNKKNSNLTTSI